MKTTIYEFLKNVYLRTLENLFSIINKVVIWLPGGNLAFSNFFKKKIERFSEVIINNLQVYFFTPNWLTKYRVKTLYSKEPDTIEWINKFTSNSVFYDIGANVGMYSIYASVQKKCKVFAFEVSPPNLECLYQNIAKNRIDDLTVIPIGLASKTKLTTLFLTRNNFTWGGAHNSLDQNVDQKGLELSDTLTVLTAGIALDDAIKFLKLPQPKYLKMDVDGMELPILKGAIKTLTRCKSILVEVDLQNTEVANQIPKLLKKLGFRKVSFKSENQIWEKS